LQSFTTVTQTSNNFTTVPFTVSGLTKSKLNELAMYGPYKFQVGVPVIKNGQIWGAITNTATTFTAYTINAVDYYDYIDGTTIFFEQSSGFTENNLTTRRPQNGLSPIIWKKIIGKKSKKNYLCGDLIKKL
jgi:hypothetical protein